MTPGPVVRGFSFLLEEAEGRLQMRALGAKAPSPLRLSWDGVEMQRRLAAGKRQILGRAIGLHRRPELSVLDATAGLCRDALSLAALGAQVFAVERHPWLAAMHRHEWLRLQQTSSLDTNLRHALGRLHCRAGEAQVWMQNASCDVIYLDPMYPKARRHALGGLEMQYLDALLGAQEDPAGLLKAALQHAHQRVVVKRPRRAMPIDGPTPSLQMSGKQTHFDIYLTHSS